MGAKQPRKPKDRDQDLAGAVGSVWDAPDSLDMFCLKEELLNANEQLAAQQEELRQQLDELEKNQLFLAEANQKLSEIIESIGEGYFETDALGIVTFANTSLCKRLGYTQDEIIGLYYRDVMNAANASKVFNAFNQVYTTGELVRDFAWELMDRSGKTVNVETTIIPIKNSVGNKTRGFRGILRDVTLKNYVQETLRASENLYRTIFENTGTASMILAEDTSIVLVNSEFERLSGYSSDELIGQSWKSLVSEYDLERMLHYHYSRRDPDSLAPRHYEFSLQTKSGQYHSIFMTIGMIPETKQSVASLLDITDRKRMEEALVQSENGLRQQVDYLNTLIRNLNEIFITYDIDGTITFVNPKLSHVLGYYCEELIGEKISHLGYSGENQHDIEKAVEEVINHRQSGTIEAAVQSKNGHKRILRMSYSPILTEGQVYGGMILAEDVTEALSDKEKLTYISLHDALTGLYNRSYFEEEIKRIEDTGEYPVAMLIADIDGLKLINDTMGHEVGDQILRITGEIMAHLCPDTCLSARIGGDEFAIIIRDASMDKINQCTSKIRLALAEHNKAHPELPLSISIGYSLRNDVSMPMNDVYREADNTMYREKLHIGQSARSAIVRTLAKALGARDFMTEGHGDRMQELVNRIGVSLGLSSRQLRDMQLLAKFHDIGKVGISDAVLFKPGPLTRSEFQEMKRHCEIGHRIALSASEMTVIADWILKHHEWWNGKGYPLGLRGEEIPLECRILSIADAYDAMISDRPYRKAMSPNLAFKELRRCAGTQFDPELVEIFLAVLESNPH